MTDELTMGTWQRVWKSREELKEMYPDPSERDNELAAELAEFAADGEPLKVEYDTFETADAAGYVHPARAAGLIAGRNHAGNEAVMVGLLEHGIGCALDESQPDDMREKSAEYAIGFAQGWREIMMVTPLFLLTRQQTARVQSLPRRVRRAWLSEYNRGVRRWQRAGGTLSGRRPVLPEIP